MMQDRPLPQATEIEGALIGTMIKFPETADDIIAAVRPEMMYDIKHQTIYKTCIDVKNKYGNADLDSVTVQLKNKGFTDEICMLAEYAGEAYTDANVQRHCLIVKENYMLREFNRIGNLLYNMSFTEDLKEVTETAENEILKLTGLFFNKEARRLDSIIDDVINNIAVMKKSGSELLGVPSGFTNIDRVTSGFKKGNLIVIAGRPGMGKTAFGLQVALNAVRLNYPTGFFSLEMSGAEIATRYLSNVSGYSNLELNNAKVDEDICCDRSAKLTGLPLFVDDSPAPSLIELKAKARRMVLKYGIKMIIVDYLGLMTPADNRQSREQQVSELSRGLKAIAKDLDIPVVALSQLNRKAEGRGDKIPELSDLRDSGSIEQDADIVMLLFRPAYYGIMTSEIDGIDINSKGVLKVNLAKNRNAPTGEKVLYHNEFMTEIRQELIKEYEASNN
jgi:replicative DNA helicase